MSLKTKMKKRKADFLDLQFCMDRPLAKELEQARMEHASRTDQMMVKTSSELVRELEKQAREATVTIRLFSMQWGAYNDLMNEHPPREGHDELFDSSTFYEAAAKATAVEVTPKGTVPIPDEDWDEFIEGLTDGEYDRIAGAVVQLNRNLATVNLAPLG